MHIWFPNLLRRYHVVVVVVVVMEMFVVMMVVVVLVIAAFQSCQRRPEALLDNQKGSSGRGSRCSSPPP